MRTKPRRTFAAGAVKAATSLSPLVTPRRFPRVARHARAGGSTSASLRSSSSCPASTEITVTALVFFAPPDRGRPAARGRHSDTRRLRLLRRRLMVLSSRRPAVSRHGRSSVATRRDGCWRRSSAVSSVAMGIAFFLQYWRDQPSADGHAAWRRHPGVADLADGSPSQPHRDATPQHRIAIGRDSESLTQITFRATAARDCAARARSPFSPARPRRCGRSSGGCSTRRP